MAGTMCAGGMEKSCTISEPTAHNGIPSPRPGNREERINHHLLLQPHRPKISGTRDPDERLMAKALGERNIASRSLPPWTSGLAAKRATLTQGLSSHSPATQLALPLPRQQHNQAADAEIPAGYDTNPRTIDSGRLHNERLIPKRLRRGPYSTAWIDYTMMPALRDIHSMLNESSRAGIG
ncbi:Hypothetical predicted protein [Pelobates cultripes]|uniref:Uncharacterized protein n=1 Tax=Pelobates cultripes TaxID=61616 RepID=A0AAD1RGL0_PELCU|nr:Hypothetical predicted protein [Pelobates cultripes]